MLDSSPTGSPAVPKGKVFIRILTLASLALTLTLAACTQTGDETPATGTETFTEDEFIEFGEKFTTDAETAIQGFIANQAVRAALGFLSWPEFPFEGDTVAPIASADWAPEVEVLLLPRGQWQHHQDQWLWERVGELRRPGMLAYTTRVDSWNVELQKEEAFELDVAVDWEKGNTPTIFYTDRLNKLELPASMAASVSLEDSAILQLDADLTAATASVACPDRPTFDISIPNRVALSGWLGGGDQTFKVADSTKLDLSNGLATSGKITASGFGEHDASLTWDVTATGTFDEASFGSIFHCGDMFDVGLEGLKGSVELFFAGHTLALGVDMSVDPVRDSVFKISDFKLTANGDVALSISGNVDVEASDPLADLTVNFADVKIDLNKYLEDLWTVDVAGALFSR